MFIYRNNSEKNDLIISIYREKNMDTRVEMKFVSFCRKYIAKRAHTSHIARYRPILRRQEDEFKSESESDN